MNCLSPFQVRDKITGKSSAVPCGRCPACRERERNDWFQRLCEEWKASKCAFFVTWTYDDAHLPLDGVQRHDIELTRKSWKKILDKFGKMSYFIVSEYGTDNLRPHYHGIMYCYYDISVYDLHDVLFACWKKCDPLRLQVDVLTSESAINYCCGYVHQRSQVPDGQNPNFKVISRSLGYSFLEDPDCHGDMMEKEEPYYWYFGKKMHLSRYYRDKLFSIRDKVHYKRIMTEYCQERESQQLNENSKHGNAFQLVEEQKESKWKTLAKKYVKHHK